MAGKTTEFEFYHQGTPLAKLLLQAEGAAVFKSDAEGGSVLFESGTLIVSIEVPSKFEVEIILGVAGEEVYTTAFTRLKRYSKGFHSVLSLDLNESNRYSITVDGDGRQYLDPIEAGKYEVFDLSFNLILNSAVLAWVHCGKLKVHRWPTVTLKPVSSAVAFPRSSFSVEGIVDGASEDFEFRLMYHDELLAMQMLEAENDSLSWEILVNKTEVGELSLQVSENSPVRIKASDHHSLGLRLVHSPTGIERDIPLGSVLLLLRLEMTASILAKPGAALAAAEGYSGELYLFYPGETIKVTGKVLDDHPCYDLHLEYDDTRIAALTRQYDGSFGCELVLLERGADLNLKVSGGAEPLGSEVSVTGLVSLNLTLHNPRTGDSARCQLDRVGVRSNPTLSSSELLWNKEDPPLSRSPGNGPGVILFDGESVFATTTVTGAMDGFRLELRVDDEVLFASDEFATSDSRSYRCRITLGSLEDEPGRYKLKAIGGSVSVTTLTGDKRQRSLSWVLINPVLVGLQRVVAIEPLGVVELHSRPRPWPQVVSSELRPDTPRAGGEGVDYLLFERETMRVEARVTGAHYEGYRLSLFVNSGSKAMVSCMLDSSEQNIVWDFDVRVRGNSQKLRLWCKSEGTGLVFDGRDTDVKLTLVLENRATEQVVSAQLGTLKLCRHPRCRPSLKRRNEDTVKHRDRVGGALVLMDTESLDLRAEIEGAAEDFDLVLLLTTTAEKKKDHKLATTALSRDLRSYDAALALTSDESGALKLEVNDVEKFDLGRIAAGSEYVEFDLALEIRNTLIDYAVQTPLGSVRAYAWPEVDGRLKISEKSIERDISLGDGSPVPVLFVGESAKIEASVSGETAGLSLRLAIGNPNRTKQRKGSSVDLPVAGDRIVWPIGVRNKAVIVVIKPDGSETALCDFDPLAPGQSISTRMTLTLVNLRSNKEKIVAQGSLTIGNPIELCVALVRPVVVRVAGHSSDVPTKENFAQVALCEAKCKLSRALRSVLVNPRFLELPWIDDTLAVVSVADTQPWEETRATLLDALAAQAMRTPGLEGSMWVALLPDMEEEEKDALAAVPAEAAYRVAVWTVNNLNMAAVGEPGSFAESAPGERRMYMRLQGTLSIEGKLSLEPPRAEMRARSVSASRAVSVDIEIAAKGWKIDVVTLKAVREPGASPTRHVAALVPLPALPKPSEHDLQLIRDEKVLIKLEPAPTSPGWTEEPHYLENYDDQHDDQIVWSLQGGESLQTALWLDVEFKAEGGGGVPLRTTVFVARVAKMAMSRSAVLRDETHTLKAIAGDGWRSSKEITLQRPDDAPLGPDFFIRPVGPGLWTALRRGGESGGVMVEAQWSYRKGDSTPKTSKALVHRSPNQYSTGELRASLGHQTASDVVDFDREQWAVDVEKLHPELLPIVLFLPLVCREDRTGNDKTRMTTSSVTEKKIWDQISQLVGDSKPKERYVLLPWADDELTLLSQPLTEHDDPRVGRILDAMDRRAAQTPGLEHALWVLVVPGPAKWSVTSTSRAAQRLIVTSNPNLGQVLKSVSEESSLRNRTEEEVLRLIGTIDTTDRIVVDDIEQEKRRLQPEGPKHLLGLKLLGLGDDNSELAQVSLSNAGSTEPARFVAFLPHNESIRVLEFRKGEEVLRSLTVTPPSDSEPKFESLKLSSRTLRWRFAPNSFSPNNLRVEYSFSPPKNWGGANDVWTPFSCLPRDVKSCTLPPICRLGPSTGLRVVARYGWKTIHKTIDNPPVSDSALTIRPIDERRYVLTRGVPPRLVQTVQWEHSGGTSTSTVYRVNEHSGTLNATERNPNESEIVEVGDDNGGTGPPVKSEKLVESSETDMRSLDGGNHAECCPVADEQMVVVFLPGYFDDRGYKSPVSRQKVEAGLRYQSGVVPLIAHPLIELPWVSDRLATLRHRVTGVRDPMLPEILERMALQAHLTRGAERALWLMVVHDSEPAESWVRYLHCPAAVTVAVAPCAGLPEVMRLVALGRSGGPDASSHRQRDSAMTTAVLSINGDVHAAIHRRNSLQHVLRYIGHITDDGQVQIDRVCTEERRLAPIEVQDEGLLAFVLNREGYEIVSGPVQMVRQSRPLSFFGFLPWTPDAHWIELRYRGAVVARRARPYGEPVFRSGARMDGDRLVWGASHTAGHPVHTHVELVWKDVRLPVVEPDPWRASFDLPPTRFGDWESVYVVAHDGWNSTLSDKISNKISNTVSNTVAQPEQVRVHLRRREGGVRYWAEVKPESKNKLTYTWDLRHVEDAPDARPDPDDPALLELPGSSRGWVAVHVSTAEDLPMMLFDEGGLVPSNQPSSEPVLPWVRTARFVGAERVVGVGVDHKLRWYSVHELRGATESYAEDEPPLDMTSGVGREASPLVCLYGDGRLVLHDLGGGVDDRRALRVHSVRGRASLVLSSNERFLAVVSGEHIHILDLEDWRSSAPLPLFARHTHRRGEMQCVRLSDDGTELWTRSGRTVLRWTLNPWNGEAVTSVSPILVTELCPERESVLAVRLASDGASLTVVTVGDNGATVRLRIDDFSGDPESHTLDAAKSEGVSVRLAAFAPDLSRVAVAFADRRVYVWEVSAEGPVAPPQLHRTEFPVLALDFGTVNDKSHLLVVQGTRTDMRRIETSEDHALF